MGKPYHLFISYASEDEEYASRLCNQLKYLGLQVWFAPLSLKAGDKLLDSINAGLMASEYGLLILSKCYLAKQWTGYELDVLHRQSIEENKRLFPLWHDVDKDMISRWNPGLTGIVALKSTESLTKIADKIADVVYRSCPTRGISPVYESAQWRFLQGCGELLANTEDGGAFNLFEAAELPDSYYPIFVDGKPRERKDIVLAVASALHYGNSSVIPIDDDKRHRMKKLCRQHGFDLDAPGFDPAVYI